MTSRPGRLFRLVPFVLLAAVVVAAGRHVGLVDAAATAPRAGAARATLPDRLTDRAFWQLTQQFSEAGGTFHSENYISNENRYQTVIPELVGRVKPGGLYLGVGPEQNFSYIAAIRPRMAFVVDIRRGNLLEHLLYKALMEMSTDRSDFVSRLFARPRPTGLGPSSPVLQLFDAFGDTPPSDSLFRRTLGTVIDLLTKTHGFPLDTEDARRIEFIYRTAFYDDGPNLMYRRTDGVNAGRRPTYAELMTYDDGTGRRRSYLAEESSFAFLKDLHTRNLIVPIVGDFGGPKALRAVAAYAREHDAIVSAFYLSNVEQYLRQDGKSAAFCASVASMPLDASSTFIRSQAAGGGFVSLLGPMQAETRGCAPGR
jgi:hypothetical protein